MVKTLAYYIDAVFGAAVIWAGAMLLLVCSFEGEPPRWFHRLLRTCLTGAALLMMAGCVLMCLAGR